MSLEVHRLLRSYRVMGPKKFHGFNQQIVKSVKDTVSFRNRPGRRTRNWCKSICRPQRSTTLYTTRPPMAISCPCRNVTYSRLSSSSILTRWR